MWVARTIYKYVSICLCNCLLIWVAFIHLLLFADRASFERHGFALQLHKYLPSQCVIHRNRVVKCFAFARAIWACNKDFKTIFETGLHLSCHEMK